MCHSETLGVELDQKDFSCEMWVVGDIVNMHWPPEYDQAVIPIDDWAGVWIAAKVDIADAEPATFSRVFKVPRVSEGTC